MTMMFRIALAVVILIGLALLLMLLAAPKSPLLLQLQKAGSQIMQGAGYTAPPHRLEAETTGTSRTIFQEVPLIRLRLNRSTGDTFTFQTLLLVYLHELSHLLCKSEGHTMEFVEIENDLTQMAIELAYITESSTIEKDYPRIDHV